MWFRRDLRLTDNTALTQALSESEKVSCIFVFDKTILELLPANDRRITFIWESLEDMNKRLAEHGSGPIHFFYGKSEELIPQIISTSKIDALYVNHDYEPTAIDRDDTIKRRCEQNGVQFCSYKDQVLFEKSEIVKTDATPYKVFTAYKNVWLTELVKLPPIYFRPQAVQWKKIHSLPHQMGMIQNIGQIGFNSEATIIKGGETAAKIRWNSFYKNLIDEYLNNRDLPGIDKTSKLSPYLRFGNISIRFVINHLKANHSKGAQTFMSELIWREFFMMILYHFPHVVQSAFNSQYEAIHWQNRKDWFNAWCEGRTGFPIVDAGMRQLNKTGFMHNRVRMITASFLVKHLHIDWRWGEKYFAEKLLDFELSSNNGNWQWAAGTGVDAAPYFRIFNPLTQSKKFDPDGIYIKRWIPELKNCSSKEIHQPEKDRQTLLFENYPQPIIDLNTERNVCLHLYNNRAGLKK